MSQNFQKNRITNKKQLKNCAETPDYIKIHKTKNHKKTTTNLTTKVNQAATPIQNKTIRKNKKESTNKQGT
jgi:hypothetical protein